MNMPGACRCLFGALIASRSAPRSSAADAAAFSPELGRRAKQGPAPESGASCRGRRDRVMRAQRCHQHRSRLSRRRRRPFFVFLEPSLSLLLLFLFLSICLCLCLCLLLGTAAAAAAPASETRVINIKVGKLFSPKTSPPSLSCLHRLDLARLGSASLEARRAATRRDAGRQNVPKETQRPN